MSQLKQRYLFIDLLRFIAVFFMIQGHVFDALLSPQIKSHSLYYLHDFFHGFIAPVFLFASGLAYGVSTIKRWDEHIVWGKSVKHRMGRFIGLIAIGYALHLPYFSLRKIISTATSAEINSWLQVDALQCIGVTLLLLQIGVFLIRSEKVFVRVVALCAAVVIFSAPYMWSAHLAEKLPVWFASYLNAENGSWFPLFPWTAYVLCGVLFGYVFLNAREHLQDVPAMRKNILFSIGILLIALLVMYLPFSFYPSHDFWKSNPAIFFVRLSVISIVASGIFILENSLRIPLHIPLIMGRESLFIYIVHLVILYGSVLNSGLNQVIGPTLSIPQSLGMFALVFLALALVAVNWHELKSRHRTASVWIRAGGTAIFLLAFVIRPW